MRIGVVLLLLLLLMIFSPRPVVAFERMLMKEFAADANLGTPCLLSGNTNGTAANYRWYNICSGYIWIYSLAEKEAFGVQFGGPEQPSIAPGSTIKRTILYYRNVIVSSAYAFRVFVDADENADGCPDSVIAWRQFYDPATRWNCVEFGVNIPDGISHVIVRAMKWDTDGDDNAFRVATDGPYSQECDPAGVGRTFYYGVNGSTCQPWRGPTGRHDNLLTWLIVDGEVPNSFSPRSWGSIKGLFR